jgi:hypothetical protein
MRQSVVLSYKDLMMIIESLEFRLEFYKKRSVELEGDDDAQADAGNDAAFLECLIAEFRSKLEASTRA